ncbi:MAG: DUF1998 domain-containing protein [Pseudomonadota bacterium]
MSPARAHGEIRQSQVLTTYGPGALVDLPNHAVIIGGLETWQGEQKPIDEPRLVARLERDLGVQGLRLLTPPADTQDPRSPRTGITAWIFPEWFLGPYASEMEEKEGQGVRVPLAPQERGRAVRCRPLVHREGLVDRKYFSAGKKKYDVVPVRFVQACRNGHISDIDWYGFVHGAGGTCRRPLWFIEEGTSGDLTAIKVRCECRRERSLATAEFAGKPKEADKKWVPLGYCSGDRPWLGNYAKERCVNENGGPEPNRLLTRTATNAYFSHTVPVISIPDRDAMIREAVRGIWDFIEDCETFEEFAQRRRKNKKVREALGELADEATWSVIQRKQQGQEDKAKGLKWAELEMLLGAGEELGEDRPEGDFYARTIPVPEGPFAASLHRVILVHRLREVVAQVGFSRFEPELTDIDGDLSIKARRAAISREATWLPAVENRGEGVFLAFRPDRIERWADPKQNPGIAPRLRLLLAGFEAWQVKYGNTAFPFPGLPYLFLHSLSHLLITTISLDCGYAASSIRERIYAVPGVGYGILLYTGSADAEGTLGGLVQQGRRIGHHLATALELGRLCSNDPVCAQHEALDPYGERFLHGAACHGCLLISETCCERRNEFLDRALVVPTVVDQDAAFFADPLEPAP